MKVLLMFSGGMDSLHVLEHLKNDPNVDELLVHHIYYISGHGRHNVELTCAAHAEKHYSSVPKISFTSSLVDISFLGIPKTDEFTHSAIAAAIANNEPSIDAISKGTRYGIPGSEKDNLYWNTFIKELQASLLYRDVVMLMPLEGKNKEETYAGIPAELRSLWWSCRKPKLEDGRFRPCHKCYPCMACDEYDITMPEVAEDKELCQSFLDKYLGGEVYR